MPTHQTIDSSCLVEEETVPGYEPEHYYPARFGQILNNRYKIVGKLGFGSASTVWLCRDTQKEESYAALKIYINRSKFQRELPVYKHINSLRSQHGGHDRIRKLLDSFEVEGPHGRHVCLVHQPVGVTFDQIRRYYLDDHLFRVDITRELFRDIMAGLEFLHKEAHVIHTDLQPSNMTVGTKDNAAFVNFEDSEVKTPNPRKELPDRTIYVSGLMQMTSGAPFITDLSEARFGGTDQTGVIMPRPYRAPEVLLDMPWSYPVDLWGLVMVIWDVFEGRPLFTGLDEERHYSEAHHLAQMIAFIGKPPLDFLQRSEKCKKYWSEDGTWKGEAPIPDSSLETAEHRLSGEEQKLFLAFIRKMLQWSPEDRGDVQNAFFDEWLLADLIASGQVAKVED